MSFNGVGKEGGSLHSAHALRRVMLEEESRPLGCIAELEAEVSVSRQYAFSDRHCSLGTSGVET